MAIWNMRPIRADPLGPHPVWVLSCFAMGRFCRRDARSAPTELAVAFWKAAGAAARVHTLWHDLAGGKSATTLIIDALQSSFCHLLRLAGLGRGGTRHLRVIDR